MPRVPNDEAGYPDSSPRSPWIAQMLPDGPGRPLTGEAQADVVIVGAGIAGIATAFWVLRDTPKDVVLLERDRVGRGATGRNAGQLTTYFERPLADIAEEFGIEQAADAQRALDGAHDLLDVLVAECAADVRVERFTGHMGMFTLEHLIVHLRNNEVRRHGNLSQETCLVSEEAEFLDDIPPEFATLYSVVPQAHIDELLEVSGAGYRAVLSDRKGCANSGALVQQVLAHLEAAYPERLRYHDETPVERVVVDADAATVQTPGGIVRCGHVVLCTNGFVDHVIVDTGDREIRLAREQRIETVVGYMAAFVEESPRPPTAMSYIRNAVIGGEIPYVYITRRTYDRPDDVVTLTCMGGPGEGDGASWHPDMPFPGPLQWAMDREVLPLAQPERPRGLPYDFLWHGPMGYNDGRTRVVGAHPEHPALLYNLGCNGIGFLPSIFGGRRISQQLSGFDLEPSIFDPRPDDGD